MKPKILIRTAIITISILMIPFIAMRFSNEVNWSLGDFIVMGALLFSTVLALSLAARSSGNIAYRIATCIAIATAFLLVWANLAVGLLGSGPNLPNLMYGGMIVVAVAGAFFTQFSAPAMARIVFTMALVQILVPAIGIIIFQAQHVPGENFEDVGPMAGMTGFFTALWLLSALLFHRAGTAAITQTEA
jgi:hypothetical protein